MQFGEKIKARREELGMTQEELAKKLGYRSRSTINKIELGINDIGQSKIIAFAKALHTTTSYLLDDCDSHQFEIDKLYNQLDTEDKAEIRGTIKGMLKSDKYKKTDIAADIKNIMKAAEHLGIKQR